MGADPEFSFVSQGRGINANSLLKDVVFKNKKDDESHMGYKIGRAGEIGWDGCSSTGEIRPAPTHTPAEMVDNIRQLIVAFWDRIKIVDMITDSKFASVGGHIHFQLDHIDNQLIPLANDGSLANSTLSERRLRLMHNRLSSFYLPLVQGDNIINLKLRKSSGYGEISDYRREVHGDNFTYEFRTPSAEWLTTPKITRAMFAYLGTIYNEIIRHPNKHKWGDIAIANMEQGNALYTLAMGKHDLFSDYFTNKIKKILPSFEFYPDYKEEINFILNGERVKAEKEAAHYNIIEGWIGKPKAPSAKLLINNKKLEQATNKMNVEETMELVGIPFNADLNVINFVNEIKKRIICFNWRLNNKYFFFGLRKGVEAPLVFNIDQRLIDGQEQIKTKGDADAITATMEKMMANFARSLNYYDWRYVDKADHGKYILFGIPYLWRNNNNYRAFIKKMIDIERKDDTNGVDLDSLTLDGHQRGEIHDAYEGKVPSERDLTNVNEDLHRRYTAIAADIRQEAIDSGAMNEVVREEDEDDDEECDEENY